MGSSTSSESLQPLQTITDPHFGEVELFKTSQIAHLMKKTFTFVQRSHRYRTLLANLKFMQEIRHSSLVPVHQLIHKQQKHLCIQYDVIEAYVEYYNFTLKSIIEAGRKLSREQIWYVLLNLSDLAIVLKEKKVQFQFDVENIFISLSGIPCIYLFDGVTSFGSDQEGLEEGVLSQENMLVVSLANTVLNLIEYGVDEERQLECLELVDKNLYHLIKGIKAGEIALEEVPGTIQSLLFQQTILVSKTLSVTTKFMNQLKKQTTQNVTQSKQKLKEKLREKEGENERQKMSLTLPSSTTVSLQFPPKFVLMEETLKGLEQKKRKNSEKQEIMKRRMEEILCKEEVRVEKGRKEEVREKENTAKTVKGANSLSLSTVTSRQSLKSSKQIEPMRSSILWRRKALEMIKKQH